MFPSQRFQTALYIRPSHLPFLESSDIARSTFPNSEILPDFKVLSVNNQIDGDVKSGWIYEIGMFSWIIFYRCLILWIFTLIRNIFGPLGPRLSEREVIPGSLKDGMERVSQYRMRADGGGGGNFLVNRYFGVE
jgi:hypothetical protein